MMQLIITFCLITDGTVCKDVRQLVEDQTISIPYQCAKFGQQQANEWLSNNPKWRVSRITCRDGKAKSQMKTEA